MASQSTDALDRRIAELEAENERLRREDSEYESLCESHQAVEAERDRLKEALRCAAEAIKDFDEGDPSTETGWKSDELLEAWLRARSALAPEPADYTGDHLNPSEFSQKEM